MKIIAAFFILFCLWSPLSWGEAKLLDNLSAALTISDFKYDSTDREFEVESKLTLANKHQQHFLYLLSISFYYERNYDEYEQHKSSEQKLDLQQRMEFNRIFELFKYSNYFELRNEKQNGQNTVKYDIDWGPLGLKRNFFKNDFITEFSFEYLPIYNFREYFVWKGENSTQKMEEESVKHTLNWLVALDLWPKLLTVTNTLTVQQIQAIDRRQINQSGNEFKNNTTFNVSATEVLEFLYSFEINTDQIRQRQQLPRTERIHTIGLTYRWN